MKLSPNGQTALAEKRTQVVDMYVKGWTQQAIADELGFNVSTICRDLQAIRKEWLASRVKDYNELKEIELIKVDNLEHEAWLAWERSREDAVRVKETKSEKDGEKIESWSEGQCGDPRFLSQVHDCIKRRCAILGLDDPIKMAQTDKDGNDLSADDATNDVNRILGILAERSGSLNSPSSN